MISFSFLFVVDPENASLEGCSVHAVAAAVGGFFRELPEPLLTRELYTEFIRAMGKCCMEVVILPILLSLALIIHVHRPDLQEGETGDSS